MSATVQIRGQVSFDSQDAFLVKVKEDFTLSYRTRDGEQITKQSTRYWNVWCLEKQNLAKGTEIVANGNYATISADPKDDGKVWPNHKIDQAVIEVLGSTAAPTPFVDTDVPF